MLKLHLLMKFKTIRCENIASFYNFFNENKTNN